MIRRLFGQAPAQALLLALLSCSPAVTTDPTPDDGVDRVCAKACANLRRLDCPEGDAPDGGRSCESVCEQARASHRIDLKPLCLASAKTREAARACGTVACP